MVRSLWFLAQVDHKLFDDLLIFFCSSDYLSADNKRRLYCREQVCPDKYNENALDIYNARVHYQLPVYVLQGS